MAIYIGNKKIGNSLLVDLEDDLNTELTEQETKLADLESQVNELSEPDISTQNIEVYKYQDLTRVINGGGTIATDVLYEQVENYLQGVYALIVGG